MKPYVLFHSLRLFGLCARFLGLLLMTLLCGVHLYSPCLTEFDSLVVLLFTLLVVCLCMCLLYHFCPYSPRVQRNAWWCGCWSRTISSRVTRFWKIKEEDHRD